MDNMAYLQQISATSKAAANQKKKFSINPKILIGIGVGIAVLLFIAVIVSIFSDVSDKERDEAMRLHVRTQYLLGTLENYTNHVKSSQLRSMGATLSTHLTELNRDLLPMLIEYWGYEDWEDDTPPEILEEEAELIDKLNTDFENARLNGILDRVYVRELALQIVLLTSIQTEIIARTEDSKVVKEDLKELLERSSKNLKELHEQFDDYSNPST